ncbi:hypothetical protein FsymDg_3068 [Candidatus Protofrankia datiscae]|uniref:Uncharacterized protein n=1 Tax=Candidatus Protofrankia datiscae TaxID=2716812 RepID=F8AXM7_9ACTN|nr:hypothetical protein FsymDg_3068 [Candidatus Protofrankia datiscae]
MVHKVAVHKVAVRQSLVRQGTVHDTVAGRPVGDDAAGGVVGVPAPAQVRIYQAGLRTR